MAPYASLCIFLLLLSFNIAHAQQDDLSPNFYRQSCPNFRSIARSIVDDAISNNPRMGAFLLRLHFHDCFVGVRIHTCYIILYICYYLWPWKILKTLIWFLFTWSCHMITFGSCNWWPPNYGAKILIDWLIMSCVTYYRDVMHQC